MQPAQYPQQGFFNFGGQNGVPQQHYPQQPAIAYNPQQNPIGSASGYTPSVVVDFNRNANSGRSLNGLVGQQFRLQPEEVSVGTASYESFQPPFIASAPDKLQDAVDEGRGRNLLGVAYSPANQVSHFKFERGNLKYNF